MTIGSAAGLSAGSPCASGPDNSLINACYNSCNSCEANADTPPCFVEYRVVPNPLVLRQVGETAPVFVYGRVTRGPLDGQWTNVQSLANGIWCSVSMSSSNESIATHHHAGRSSRATPINRASTSSRPWPTATPAST